MFYNRPMKTALTCALAAAALSAAFLGCATDETSNRTNLIEGARRVNFRLSPTEAGGLARCSYMNTVSVSTGKTVRATPPGVLIKEACRAFSAAAEKDHNLPVKRDATGQMMDDVIACNWIAEIPDHPACPWGDLSKAKVEFVAPEAAR